VRAVRFRTPRVSEADRDVFDMAVARRDLGFSRDAVELEAMKRVRDFYDAAPHTEFTEYTDEERENDP